MCACVCLYVCVVCTRLSRSCNVLSLRRGAQPCHPHPVKTKRWGGRAPYWKSGRHPKIDLHRQTETNRLSTFQCPKIQKPAQIVCRNFVLPGHILGRCRSPWRRWRPKSWAYYHEGSRQMAKLRWMRRRTCSTVHSFGSPSSSTLWEGGEGGAERGGGEDWEGGGDEGLGLPSPSVFTRFSVRSRAASAWWGIC